MNPWLVAALIALPAGRWLKAAREARERIDAQVPPTGAVRVVKADQEDISSDEEGRTG